MCQLVQSKRSRDRLRQYYSISIKVKFFHQLLVLAKGHSQPSRREILAIEFLQEVASSPVRQSSRSDSRSDIHTGTCKYRPMMGTSSSVQDANLVRRRLHKANGTSGYIERLEWGRGSLYYRKVIYEGYKLALIDAVWSQGRTVCSHEREWDCQSTAYVYPWDDDRFLLPSVSNFMKTCKPEILTSSRV
jgi:hypothetical protein